MKGYVFEYYKYVRYPKGTLADIKECLSYEDAEKSILTFGEYDRLKINNMAQFDRFRDLSKLAKEWIGNRQSILLYDFGDEPRYIYEDDQEKWGFKAAGTQMFDDHLFWALTELPFRSVLREKMDTYDDLLRYAREKLCGVIGEACGSYSDKPDYVVLGTLGTFGIAVLWFGNQYTDILKIVNCIKRNSKFKKERMYLTAHTIFSKNPLYNTVQEENSLIESIKGTAYVQLTVKKWIDSELKKISGIGKNLRQTSGEYDLEIEMTARDAFVSFEKEEIFDHDKNTYQNSILQTRVTLGVDVEKTELESETSDLELADAEDLKQNLKDNLLGCLQKENDAYVKLRSLIKENVDKSAGLVDTLDSLHCDYRYNVTSAVNQSWADDFSYIFLKNMECMREIINMDKSYKIDVMSILRVVLNNLKQQIFHISESNNLSFEIPKCHLRYTGQEDCILFGYMGIIKDILHTAYQLEGYNKQTEIIPVVTVDILPVIESEMYFDKSSYVDVNDADQEFKIVSLNLPHAAFYDVPLYTLYLYHEIYHYIVPRDREERDYVMGVLLSTIYCHDILDKVFSSLFRNRKGLAMLILNYIDPILYSTIGEQYSEVHKTITGFGRHKRKCKTDTVLLIGEVYKNELIKNLNGPDSCIEQWILKICERLERGEVQGLSFEKLQLKCGQDGEKTVPILRKWFDDVRKGIYRIEPGQATSVTNKVLQGMKEVSADIPMIELSGMSLSEYLLLYSCCLKNELVNPDGFDRNEDLHELVRIGMVLDYFKAMDCSLKKIKDEFIYLYIAKYIRFMKDEASSLTDAIRKRREEAEKWYHYFENSWRMYQSQFVLYKKLCSTLTKLFGVKNRLPSDDIYEKKEYYFKTYRSAYAEFSDVIKCVESLDKKGKKEKAIQLFNTGKNKVCEKIFAENIKLINHFQAQENLTHLSVWNKENNEKKENNNQAYMIPVFRQDFANVRHVRRRSGTIMSIPVIYDLNALMDQMNSVTKRLQKSCHRMFNKREYPLWYRGQSNSNYGLLPSIMRKNDTGRQEFNYLSQYQRYLFEEFKYRSDGAPEVINRSHYAVSDYLALMQHYGVHTNLMDWSEDAFTGLYFALEPLITHEKEMLKNDAVIFVFSPHLYNDARNYMISEGASATSCTERSFLASKKTAGCSDGLIPNIAVNYNKDVYDMFLMGNLNYESGNAYGNEREMALNGKEEMAYLPLAVYTSRLNPRIRSQSGIFVAYNLYAEPSAIIDSYDYIDLEKIQTYYFERSERKEKEQFLYRIVIEKTVAKEIAECLSRMGISKERIYPELANIGQRIR